MAKDKDKFNLNIDTEEMARLGVHFGHGTSHINPKIKPYLAGSKNNVHLFDLEKTKEKLFAVLEFIKKLVGEEKILLLVGTKIQTKNLVKEIAEACELPYVAERWLGGTFTNFGTILKRIEYFKDLEKKKATGELEKYTKKERAKIDEELREFEKKFGGIKNLTRLPDAVFVCDMLKDKLALREAKIKGVKIIAICDTNTDPTLADLPIPASDDAASSVKYILEKVKEAILHVKHQSTKKTA